MRVLVTGATGCLGRHLAIRLLLENYNVLVTGRNQNAGRELEQKGAHFQKAMLEDRESIIDLCHGQNIVFHCGALSSNWGKYEDFYNANVIGTKNVIEGCKKAKARLIYVSSPSIYFNFSDALNIKETIPLPRKFVNHYVTTKRLSEKLIDQAHLEGIEVITIRPRGIFGPHDQSIIPRIVRLAKKGRMPLINNGENIIDVTYVENVVDALLLSAKASKACLGKKYNISNNEPVPLKKLLEMLFEKMEMKVSFYHLPYHVAITLAFLMESYSELFQRKEPKLTRYSVGILSKSQTLDISAAQKDLGYVPKVSIEDGLECYAKWWKETYES